MLRRAMTTPICSIDAHRHEQPPGALARAAHDDRRLDRCAARAAIARRAAACMPAGSGARRCRPPRRPRSCSVPSVFKTSSRAAARMLVDRLARGGLLRVRAERQRAGSERQNADDCRAPQREAASHSVRSSRLCSCSCALSFARHMPRRARRRFACARRQTIAGRAAAAARVVPPRGARRGAQPQAAARVSTLGTVVAQGYATDRCLATKETTMESILGVHESALLFSAQPHGSARGEPRERRHAALQGARHGVQLGARRRRGRRRLKITNARHIDAAPAARRTTR